MKFISMGCRDDAGITAGQKDPAALPQYRTTEGVGVGTSEIGSDPPAREVIDIAVQISASCRVKEQKTGKTRLVQNSPIQYGT